MVGCAGQTPAAPNSSGSEDPLRQVQDCMKDAGWDVEIAEDGSISTFVPTDQASEYEAASAKCWESYPVKAFADLTEAEQSNLYAKHVAVRDCVVALGIDVAPAPSFQSWVDSGGAWGGYSDVPQDVLLNQWDEINTKCPQPTG